MTHPPRPDDDHYDEWLDTQQAIGDHLALLEEDITGRMSADQAISAMIERELCDAVFHAVQWLDVPTVLRAVASTIERFDQRQDDDDDCPF